MSNPTPAEVFELVEHLILDCPRKRLHIVDHATGKPYQVVECYESDWSIYITIEPTEK